MQRISYKSTLKTSCAGLVLLAGLTLSACGGGGGSSSSSGSSGGGGTPPLPAGNTFGLNGAAAKGLILNGDVSVVDAADESDVLVTGTTSATDGSYDVTIPASVDFDGPFVKITVTGGAGATMICDAATGCGTGIAFGDPVAIDDTVSISAIIPTPANGATTTSNVTALTDMAAALAQAGTLSQTSLNSANSGVAALFGIVSSDLNGLPVVNLSSADADTSDRDAALAAAVSGGILQTALEDPAGLGAALANLSSNFAAAGSIVVNEGAQDTSVISLKEILGGASDALDETPADSGTLTTLETEIAASELEASAQDAGTTSDQIDPNKVQELLDLEKGKAFIADLQLIQTAAQLDSTETNFEDFGNALDDANAQFDPAYKAVSQSIEALLATQENYIRSVETADFFGADFNISYDELSTEEQEYSQQAYYGNDGYLTRLVQDGFDIDVSNSGETYTIATQDVEIELVSAVYNPNFDPFGLSGEPEFLTPAVTQVIEINLKMTYTDTRVSDEINDASPIGQGYGAFYRDSLTGDQGVTIFGEVTSDDTFLTITDASLSITGFDSILMGRGRDIYSTSNASSSYFNEDDLVFAQLDINLEALVTNAPQTGVDPVSFEGVLQFGATDYQSSDLTFDNFIYDYELNTETSGVGFSDTRTRFAATSFGLSGDFTVNGASADITLMLELNDYSVSEAPEEVTLATSTVTGNTVSLEYALRDDFADSWTLDSKEDTDAFITALEANGINVGFGGQVDENGNPISYYSDFRDANYSGDVLYWEVNFSTHDTYTFFDNADLANFGIAPQGFDLATYSNVADALNAARALEIGTLGCQPNGALYYSPQLPILPTVTEFLGYKLTQDDSPACENTGPTIPYTGFVYDYDTVTTQPTDLNGTLSASITQDIAGIDADDPSVTLSASGTLVADDAGEIDGALGYKIEFAGRRFETNSINLLNIDEQLGDVDGDLIVTNQDDVVLTLSQDADTDTYSGTLTLGDTQLATIAETAGVFLVTFNDDSFVSLQ